MNILFVNYGDYASNSLNHIGAFANRLTLLGHACVVAVPENPDSISVIPEPLFTPATFPRALQRDPLFPDRRPADLVHAWTPRENVREFTLRFLQLDPGAALVVHLEDNEAFLMESFAHQPIAELRALSDEELAERLSPRLSHPVRFRSFLRLAHGATYITERLREFVPAGKPRHLLLPGVSSTLYHPRPADPALREKLGLRAEEKVLVFTGSTTFANLADVRSLLLAVRLLNERGTPCRLLRTGINPPQMAAELAALGGAYVLDLGFVPKTELAALLALADVLVQPGAPDLFNDYRLPSKVPEFLCMGRPVVLPAANLGRAMEDGREALLLRTGSAEEIVAQCQRVFGDPVLARRLGEGAVAFAQAHFDLAKNTADLAAFYDQIRGKAEPLKLDPNTAPSEDVLLAKGDAALRMRAKEQSIEFHRRRAAARDEEIARLNAAVAARDETVRSLQQAVTELQRGTKEQQNALVELQSTVQRLNASHAELEAQKAALAAEHHASATRFEAEKARWQQALQTETAALTRRQDQEKAELTARQAAEIAALTAERERERAALLARLESETAALTAEHDREKAALLARLESETAALTAKFRAELQALGDEFLRDKAVLAALTDYHHTKLHDARRQLDVLKRELAEAHIATGHKVRELEQANSRFQEALATLRQREDKIRRMTKSLSWQSTSPLRWLRRRLIDPLKSRRAVAAKAHRPKIDASLKSVIDEPAQWHEIAPTGTLRGWVVSLTGEKLRAVRLCVNGAAQEAHFGLSRPDVAAGLPRLPHALKSGFSLAYTLPPQTVQSLTLEALTDSGHWRCFSNPTANVGVGIPLHLRRDYATWVERFDAPTADAAAALQQRVDALPGSRQPLISVILPVYNTPERWLVKAIESVRTQLYSHWELCIANDASPADHVRPLLDRYAAEDRRIKVVHRTANGHISAASNSALELASGEFVALLDHDDELAPAALAQVALALADQPALEFIYSDEDKIDEQGQRFEPYFKPDWNPDLLLGQNYTCHLSVFRTSRVRAIGGFRIGYEGSQDWDLTLRYVEGLDPATIHHLPRILYHWRAIDGSTALAVDQKQDYPAIAAEKALNDHLQRTGTAGSLARVPGSHWRVKRAVPTPAPKVSIIIPTRNCANLLRQCVGSLLSATTYPDYEIIVVNNRSDDQATLDFFREVQPAVRVVDYDAPFNFSAINNFAAKHVTGSILAFLNNDLEVITPDWLDEMVSHAVRPEIGCVGAMLYYPNDTVQHAGVILGLTGPAGKDGVAGHAFKGFPRGAEGQRNRLRLVQNYSAVTAACLVIRRELFEQVGGYNERELAVAFNDVDFCLRVRAAGFRNLWTPFAEFYHHESASRGHENTPEKIARFNGEGAYMRKTWGSLLDQDPAYNPNLSLQHEDFSLAFPPRTSS